VDQIAARVLYRDEAGIWRSKVLSLVCMSRIEHLVAQAQFFRWLLFISGFRSKHGIRLESMEICSLA
jgi:hypothetical protein